MENPGFFGLVAEVQDKAGYGGYNLKLCFMGKDKGVRPLVVNGGGKFEVPDTSKSARHLTSNLV